MDTVEEMSDKFYGEAIVDGLMLTELHLNSSN